MYQLIPIINPARLHEPTITNNKIQISSRQREKQNDSIGKIENYSSKEKIDEAQGRSFFQLTVPSTFIIDRRFFQDCLPCAVKARNLLQRFLDRRS